MPDLNEIDLPDELVPEEHEELVIEDPTPNPYEEMGDDSEEQDDGREPEEVPNA